QPGRPGRWECRFRNPGSIESAGEAATGVLLYVRWDVRKPAGSVTAPVSCRAGFAAIDFYIALFHFSLLFASDFNLYSDSHECHWRCVCLTDPRYAIQYFRWN